jgi:hypothetical protein
MELIECAKEDGEHNGLGDLLPKWREGTRLGKHDWEFVMDEPGTRKSACRREVDSGSE